jgi:acyl-CoA synthetase (NDP forming)
VVGASSRAESLSGRLLGNLVAAGYTGAVYPVNPRAETVGPFRCYQSLRAIPETLDLAAIVCWTSSGSTGLRVSRERPKSPIIAFCRRELS